MIKSRGFGYITGADFIVRSAYQMGKNPLLPVFAISLGAGDAFIGLIVSVSTLTGMVLKPFFGVLSDQSGRKVWLIVGTAFFALMPFVYRFVHTPEQLFAVRLVHGVATAIYGPVTLAYVAEQSKSRRAERLAWFGAARNAGYVIGPAAAGWMLLKMDPVSVFTIVGIMSSVAFIPVLLLPETVTRPDKSRGSLVRKGLRAVVSGGRTPAVWLAGGMESGMFLALYATKTFLPLYALSVGFNVAVAGAFLAVQGGAHILLNPIGGRLGDRLGYLVMVPVGMLVLAVSLPLITMAGSIPFLMAIAVTTGLAQALVFPSTVALVSSQMNDRNLATGMGLVGTLKNAGKVAGPAIAGLLIYWLDYEITFRIMGIALVFGAALVWYLTRSSRSSIADRTKRNAIPARS